MTWILARALVLYIYLLSFARFWSLSIERFWFLSWIAWHWKPAIVRFFFVRLFWCFKSKIHVAIVVRIRAETLATQPRFSSPLFYFSDKITPGVTSLYKSYRYVPPQRVFFAPFWSENEYKFCPFWSGVGYGFRGNYGSMNIFVISPPKRIRKKKGTMRIRNAL